MFYDDPDAINDGQSNITSLLLVFNKIVVFRQQMLFFRLISNFYMNKYEQTWKINIWCRKTTFLLKTGNNYAMLLPASNIASRAHDDNSNQNQSKNLRFSKNLEFWQFLKMDIELHICCHEYDLSNITNWQHIGGGPLWQQIGNKFLLPPCLRAQFSFVMPIFQLLIKSTIFSNKNNKCCF